MHSTYQITGNDLARAFAGIAQTVAKPAKKVRDNSLQAAVMAEAHKRYRQYRESNSKTQMVDGRWKRVPAAYSAADFGAMLIVAWNHVKFLQSKAAWESRALPTATIDETTFQSCRTDGMMGW